MENDVSMFTGHVLSQLKQHSCSRNVLEARETEYHSSILDSLPYQFTKITTYGYLKFILHVKLLKIGLCYYVQFVNASP